MSPRNPSTSSSLQTCEIFNLKSSDILTLEINFLASTIRFFKFSCSSLYLLIQNCGSASKSVLSSTTLTRSFGSLTVFITACIPNLSNNCGLNSPSSGFPEPTKTNRAGCLIEIPSRSTVLIPDAAESKSISTK